MKNVLTPMSTSILLLLRNVRHEQRIFKHHNLNPRIFFERAGSRHANAKARWKHPRPPMTSIRRNEMMEASSMYAM
eukprot:scaffold479774_cov55-Attheya_sp.AAC.4